MASPLSEIERDRIARNVAAVKQHPAQLAAFKELHAAGLVDGWRAILYVGPARTGADRAGHVVADADMVLGSNAALMIRKP